MHAQQQTVSGHAATPPAAAPWLVLKAVCVCVGVHSPQSAGHLLNLLPALIGTMTALLAAHHERGVNGLGLQGLACPV